MILSLQFFIFYLDSVNRDTVLVASENNSIERLIDSLKHIKQKEKTKVYRFNPNYISDYKGYLIGMSLEEIDRLHAYRKKNLFVNSAKKFQEITKISDSLLEVLTPYFKFPKWVENRNKKLKNRKFLSKKKWDINTSAVERFREINGIGEVLSNRIVKFREIIGGFLLKDQLYEVYGLKKQTVEKILERFDIISKPSTNRLDINEASVKMLSKIYFISYGKALEIITYRTRVGRIKSLKELKTFIKDSLNRKHLSLYLKV